MNESYQNYTLASLTAKGRVAERFHDVSSIFLRLRRDSIKTHLHTGAMLGRVILENIPSGVSQRRPQHRTNSHRPIIVAGKGSEFTKLSSSTPYRHPSYPLPAHAPTTYLVLCIISTVVVKDVVVAMVLLAPSLQLSNCWS